MYYAKIIPPYCKFHTPKEIQMKDFIPPIKEIIPLIKEIILYIKEILNKKFKTKIKNHN